MVQISVSLLPTGVPEGGQGGQSAPPPDGLQGKKKGKGGRGKEKKRRKRKKGEGKGERKKEKKEKKKGKGKKRNKKRKGRKREKKRKEKNGEVILKRPWPYAPGGGAVDPRYFEKFFS